MESMQDKIIYNFQQSDLDLIRHISLSWDPAESGAPILNTIHPKEGADIDPEDLFSILGDFIGVKMAGEDYSDEELENLWQAFYDIGECVMPIFAWHAKLKPGTYTTFNPWSEIPVDDFFEGSNIKIPMKEETLEFELTETHLKLIPYLKFRFYDEYQRPTVDSKRPYGDMSYFYIDMAEALGIEVPVNDEGEAEFDQKQIDVFEQLHHEMLIALTVFFKYADIELKEYNREEAYISW